jgi:hypothetical protein
MLQVVIPCSGPKKATAPTMELKKRPISFVAKPSNPDECAPWDPITPSNIRTWIDCLADYNNNGQLNPKDIAVGVSISSGCKLFCAGALYKNKIYAELIQALGFTNVFILSAGWGLVRADVRLPPYNITFSNEAPFPARITVANRLSKIKLLLPPNANGAHVFAGRSYANALNRMLPNHVFSIELCNGRQRQWYYAAARTWLKKQLLCAPKKACMCPCGFSALGIHCDPLPLLGGVVLVV